MVTSKINGNQLLEMATSGLKWQLAGLNGSSGYE